MAEFTVFTVVGPDYGCGHAHHSLTDLAQCYLTFSAASFPSVYRTRGAGGMPFPLSPGQRSEFEAIVHGLTHDHDEEARSYGLATGGTA